MTENKEETLSIWQRLSILSKIAAGFFVFAKLNTFVTGALVFASSSLAIPWLVFTSMLLIACVVLCIVDFHFSNGNKEEKIKRQLKELEQYFGEPVLPVSYNNGRLKNDQNG